MKKITTLVIIGLSLLLPRILHSQNVLNGVLMKSDAELITAIDKIKQEIKNNLNTFKKTEEQKDSTGYRYVYKKEKELQLLMVDSKTESMDKKVEWYFYKGQLVYTEKIWTDIATNKIVDTEKLYLNNEHLFTWIKAGKPIDVGSKDFKHAADQLLIYSSMLKKSYMK